jgi:hypothetical protein
MDITCAFRGSGDRAEDAFASGRPMEKLNSPINAETLNPAILSYFLGKI